MKFARPRAGTTLAQCGYGISSSLVKIERQTDGNDPNGEAFSVDRLLRSGADFRPSRHGPACPPRQAKNGAKP
jgi:hypothetical protein